jgi:hypothetical protein
MMTATAKRSPYPRFIGGYAMPQYPTIVEDADRCMNRDFVRMTAAERRDERVGLDRALATASSRACVMMPPPLYSVNAKDWIRKRLDALDAFERRQKTGRR